MSRNKGLSLNEVFSEWPPTLFPYCLQRLSPDSVRGMFQIVNLKSIRPIVFFPALDYAKDDIKKGMNCVNTLFAKALRKLREEKGFTQKQLGQKLYVNHSTITRWENATRLPDITMIPRIADCLGVSSKDLFELVVQSEEKPNVIIVDDSKPVLVDGLAVLGEVMPNATVTGFIWPQEAIEYAKANQIALAILDIELGTASGLDLSRTLVEINPRTNIVFLTAYADYSLDAWETTACGFLLKPLTAENVQKQLKQLRFPFSMGGETE